MLDIGMSEMVVIGVVALIVVGPKDLPQMFRKVGTFVGKARGMARDFQNAMHDAADDAGVNDIKSSFDQASSMKDLGLDDLGASKDYSDYLKPTADQTTAKPAAKTKTAVKKPATKATAKKAAPKKAATKNTAPKKSAAQKPAAKKTAAKKAT